MKIIMGTYRADMLMVKRAMDSIWKHVKGVDGFIFVDDSGNEDFRYWASSYGDVRPVAVTNKGYARAMEQVCSVMLQGPDEYYCFWEEDFVAVKDFDLRHLADELANDPTLAQVVLKRQPWFPNEIERGDVIAAMVDRLDGALLIEQGVHEQLFVHQMTFSCNPAVWAPMAYRWPWPQCNDSEDEKTQYLVNDDKASFAFFGSRVLVHHDGERTGSGY